MAKRLSFISLVLCLLIIFACLKNSNNEHIEKLPQVHLKSSLPASFDNSISPVVSSLNKLIENGVFDIVISDTILLIDDLAIPYGYSVEIRNGGMIKCLKPTGLTIYGNFSAKNSKVFDDNLNVVFGAGSTERVNVTWFGALADAQLSIGIEGGDDTKQIQRAINSAQAVKNVFFPSYRLPEYRWYGAYRISKTLQVRVPNKVFQGISLFGEESYDIPKSVIYADFNSMGAINIQSSRGTIIAFLAFQGKNLAPDENKESYSNSLSDYISKGIEVDEKTAYSGITIDANPGEPGSANTIIKYCRISRFFVGISVNAAGETQGDMLSVEHNALEYNAVHLAIGSSQARSVTVTRCDIGRGHTVIDNVSYGAKLGSTINFSQNQITNCYQLLNYNTAAAGPSEMSGNYAENIGRIGKVLGGRNQNTLTLRDGTYKFAPTGYKVKKFFEGQTNLLISSCLIQVNGKENLIFANSKASKFENTRFRGKKGMPTVTGENLIFENCTISNAYNEETINSPVPYPSR